jgi:hypothetical protein
MMKTARNVKFLLLMLNSLSLISAQTTSKYHLFIHFLHTVNAGTGSVKFQSYDSTNFQITIKVKFKKITLIKGNVGTYIGLGFGMNMKNLDIHTVEFLNATDYNLVDRFGKANGKPSPDKDLGGTSDLKNVEYSVDASGIPTIKYIRAYNTGDIYDNIVMPNTWTPVSLVWNTGTLKYHSKNYIITLITFDSSKLVVQSASSKDTLSTKTPSSTVVVISNTTTSQMPQLILGGEFNFWEFHGVILTIIWSIMNFFGYVTARFLRHYPIWIWIHFTCSGLTAMVSVGIMATSILKSKYVKLYYL